jgi:hypothetical protein
MDGQQAGVDVPDPWRPNATATATLDDKFMAESVVVKHGANTYEFTYSDYKGLEQSAQSGRSACTPAG